MNPVDRVPAPFLPLLITGVAGVPGYNAFRAFRAVHGDQVIGVRRPDHWPLGGPGIVPCDLEDATQVAELWEQHRFAAVLNSAGSCRLKSCELDPEMARRVNVVTTSNVMRQAARFGARVIHLSIDLVFAGREAGGYREGDPTDPVTVYGAAMAEAESVVLSLVPEATVLRISLPMGVSFNGHAGAIDWIASRFKKGKPATLYFDEIRTPTYVDCMNRVYERLLRMQAPGIFHAGGPVRLSLYQIAQIVNVAGDYAPELLKGCLRHEAGPIPPRAGDVTLDSARLRRLLGDEPFDPWPLAEAWIPDAPDWHLRSDLRRGGSVSRIESLLYRNPAKLGAASDLRIW